MIGGDGVTKQAEHARADDRFDLSRFALEADQKGWFLDVRALLFPIEQVTRRDINFVPTLIPIESVGIASGEHLGLHCLCFSLGDFHGGRPDVAQIDVASVTASPDRLGGQVDIDGACQCVCDH